MAVRLTIPAKDCIVKDSGCFLIGFGEQVTIAIKGGLDRIVA